MFAVYTLSWDLLILRKLEKVFLTFPLPCIVLSFKWFVLMFQVPDHKCSPMPCSVFVLTVSSNTLLFFFFCMCVCVWIIFLCLLEEECIFFHVFKQEGLTQKNGFYQHKSLFSKVEEESSKTKQNKCIYVTLQLLPIPHPQYIHTTKYVLLIFFRFIFLLNLVFINCN